MRLIVIHNPIAGRRRPGFLERVVAALLRRGCSVDLRETRAPGDAARMAGAVRAEDCDRLVVAGGDGTVNEAVDGLVRIGPSAPPLALIPLGTANVLAREIGLPGDPEALAAVIAGGEARPVALGLAGDRHFTLMAGAGFDARVVASVRGRLKARLGRTAYVLMSLRHILTYRRRLYAVEIDGEAFTAAAVVVANARHYAGPFVIAPAADLASPRLQVCLFERAGRRHAVRYAVALLTGRLPRLPDFRIVEGRRVRITAREAGEPVQLDGDVATSLPCEISIRPAALSLVYPAAPAAAAATGRQRRA